MITLLFSNLKMFAAGPVRNLLKQHVPLYTWTVGEEDDGEGPCPTSLERPVLICGRSNTASIFVEVREDHRSEDGLPSHAQKVVIDRPTTDNDTLAERIAMTIATTAAFVDKDHVRVRVPGNDKWLRIEDMVLMSERVLEGERLESVSAEFGGREVRNETPANSGSRKEVAAAMDATGDREPAPGLGTRSNLHGMPFDDRPPQERGAVLGVNVIGLAASERTMLLTLANEAKSLGALYDMSSLPKFHSEQPSAERLPTLAMLYNAEPTLSLPEVEEALGVIDKDGGWRAREADCDLIVEGRGGTIRLAFNDHPLPPFMVELGLDRSLGASRGEAMSRLRRHKRHATIVADIDPTAASWIDVRQTAKAMIMLIALAHKPTQSLGNLVGVYNAATASFFTDDMIADLVGALAQNEVSIKTFIWHAYSSTEPDKVTITSAGLLPFVGRELEIIEAPGDLEFVADRLNNIERYLLIEGPVVGDGDTIGDVPGEPWARLWHGISEDKSRIEPVPVYKAEICGPGGRWRPRHDPPRADPPLGSGGMMRQPDAPESQPAARPGGFGRRATVFGRRGT